MSYESVLVALDIPLSYQRDDEVNGLCPMHKERTGKEDHKPSWWLNLETGKHICFSCQYKGNIYTLVRDLRGLSHEEILDFIDDQSEATTDELLERFKALPQFVSADSSTIPITEAHLAVYSEPPDWALRGRSISREAAKAYGVLWDTNRLSWILPIRDPDTHKLWGWQEKAAIGRFFRNHPIGVKKSKTVFGVDVVEYDCPVIVVESPLDAVRLYSIGYTAVSTFGALISEEQVKLLRKAEKQIIAAFDNPYIDPAGKKACEEVGRYARKYGLELQYFNYSGLEAKDPGDMTRAEIEQGVTNSIDMIYGERAYS